MRFMVQTVFIQTLRYRYTVHCVHLLGRLILRGSVVVLTGGQAGVDHEDAVREDHADTACHHDPPPHTRGEHPNNIYCKHYRKGVLWWTCDLLRLMFLSIYLLISNLYRDHVKKFSSSFGRRQEIIFQFHLPATSMILI